MITKICIPYFMYRHIQANKSKTPLFTFLESFNQDQQSGASNKQTLSDARCKISPNSSQV